MDEQQKQVEDQQKQIDSQQKQINNQTREIERQKKKIDEQQTKIRNQKGEMAKKEEQIGQLMRDGNQTRDALNGEDVFLVTTTIFIIHNNRIFSVNTCS